MDKIAFQKVILCLAPFIWIPFAIIFYIWPPSLIAFYMNPSAFTGSHEKSTLTDKTLPEHFRSELSSRKVAPFDGWKYATPELVCAFSDEETNCSENESFMLQNLSTPYYIEADFNGDGLQDDAGIQINDRGEERVIAFLRKSNGSEMEIVLREVAPVIPKLYVRLVTDAEIPTWCAKMGECAQGEAEVIQLENPGIEFRMFEATGLLFYWDKTKDTFSAAQTSD